MHDDRFALQSTVDGASGRNGQLAASHARAGKPRERGFATVLPPLMAATTAKAQRPRPKCATSTVVPVRSFCLHCTQCECRALSECQRLRRPYQGSIKCIEHDDHDVVSCTVQCRSGFAFSGPVEPVYVCGRNTSYLWPHESPDNPRCIIPACTSG